MPDASRSNHPFVNRLCRISASKVRHQCLVATNHGATVPHTPWKKSHMSSASPLVNPRRLTYIVPRSRSAPEPPLMLPMLSQSKNPLAPGAPEADSNVLSQVI